MYSAPEHKLPVHYSDPVTPSGVIKAGLELGSLLPQPREDYRLTLLHLAEAVLMSDPYLYICSQCMYPCTHRGMFVVVIAYITSRDPELRGVRKRSFLEESIHSVRTNIWRACIRCSGFAHSQRSMVPVLVILST